MPTKPRPKAAPKAEERTEQIHVRLTPTEKREFDAFAEEESVPLGPLMRQALKRMIAERRKSRRDNPA